MSNVDYKGAQDRITFKCVVKFFVLFGKSSNNHSAGKHDRGPSFFYIIFIKTHQNSFSWFNLSSKYYNTLENITGKRSDPVRKIIV